MQPAARIYRLFLAVFLVVGLASVAEAARRKPMYQRPAANQNNQQNQQKQPAQPPAPKGPKVVAFKELPDNTDFYFASDAGHYIRYTKISATSARTAVTAVNRTSTVVPISATQQVISVDEVEKAAAAAKKT